MEFPNDILIRFNWLPTIIIVSDWKFRNSIIQEHTVGT